MKLPILKCKRPGCGHSWIPRRPQMPKVCPRCKQDDWNAKPKAAAVVRHDLRALTKEGVTA